MKKKLFLSVFLLGISLDVAADGFSEYCAASRDALSGFKNKYSYKIGGDFSDDFLKKMDFIRVKGAPIVVPQERMVAMDFELTPMFESYSIVYENHAVNGVVLPIEDNYLSLAYYKNVFENEEFEEFQEFVYTDSMYNKMKWYIHESDDDLLCNSRNHLNDAKKIYVENMLLPILTDVSPSQKILVKDFGLLYSSNIDNGYVSISEAEDKKSLVKSVIIEAENTKGATRTYKDAP